MQKSPRSILEHSDYPPNKPHTPLPKDKDLRRTQWAPCSVWVCACMCAWSGHHCSIACRVASDMSSTCTEPDSDHDNCTRQAVRRGFHETTTRRCPGTQSLLAQCHAPCHCFSVLLGAAALAPTPPRRAGCCRWPERQREAS